MATFHNVLKQKYFVFLSSFHMHANCPAYADLSDVVVEEQLSSIFFFFFFKGTYSLSRTFGLP
jgi:hypothetical protein